MASDVMTVRLHLPQVRVLGPRVWTRFVAEGSVGHLAVFYERDHTGLG